MNSPVLERTAALPRGGSASRLFNFERRWLLEVLESLMPSGADPRMPVGASDVPLGHFLDDLVESAPEKFVMGLRACLWIVILCPPFVLRRLTTFFGLAPQERVTLMYRLRESNLYVVRELPMLLKTVGCLGMCGLPEVQQRLGITPTDKTPPQWARVAESSESAE
jgi:hypothetical protein